MSHFTLIPLDNYKNNETRQPYGQRVFAALKRGRGFLRKAPSPFQFAPGTFQKIPVPTARWSSSRISFSTVSGKPSTLSTCSFVTPSMLPRSTIACRYDLISLYVGSTCIFSIFCIYAANAYAPQLDTVAIIRLSTSTLHGTSASLSTITSYRMPIPISFPPSPTPNVGIPRFLARSKRISAFAVFFLMLTPRIFA